MNLTALTLVLYPPTSNIRAGIDGTQQGNITGIDNDTRKVDRVALGAVSGVDTGTRGVEYFDAFESRRTTYIGPVNDVTSIVYTYDNVYRLTKANYSSGNVFTYTYDAVGNRLTEQLNGGSVVNSVYDHANRLINSGGLTYTWDNNGNWLNDGAEANYTYDAANRLIHASLPGLQGDDPGGPTSEYEYAYTGLGDRVRQSTTICLGPCGSATVTTYTLDLNAGLTQVLADGTNTYLYGHGRIAEYAGTTPDYFMGDALGSVRQLSNASKAVTLAQSYQPYGELLSTTGGGATSYAFTGEWQDATGLVHLRARYYAPTQGRFIQHDAWPGDYNRPLTRNGWNYVEGNPINHIDPSGYCEGDRPIGENSGSVSLQFTADDSCWALVAKIEQELGGSSNIQLQGMNSAWGWYNELDTAKLQRIVWLIGANNISLGERLTTNDINGEARLWLLGAYGRSLALKNQAGQIDAVEALARWATFTANLVQHELGLGERQAFADLMLLGTSHVYEPGMLRPSAISRHIFG